MELQIQPDQDYFQQHLSDIQDAVQQAHRGSGTLSGMEGGPELLDDAFAQLLEIVARVESDARATDSDHPGVRQTDITELGEYCIGLLVELEQWVQRYRLEEEQMLLAEVYLAFALWIARHGGELLTLEPVVDALAQFANRTLDAEQLSHLFTYMGEILEAVSPTIRQDLEKTNPGRPWRVLNLNRAIVATRSHDPDAMKQAFDSLTTLLPEEAPRFFAEGMEQMEALDYPAHVRDVMEHYYKDWNRKHQLH